jgi:uncharacterized integral membrane protein
MLKIIMLFRQSALILTVLSVLMLIALLIVKPVAEYNRLTAEWDFLIIIGILTTLICGVVYTMLRIMFNTKKLF